MSESDANIFLFFLENICALLLAIVSISWLKLSPYGSRPMLSKTESVFSVLPSK